MALHTHVPPEHNDVAIYHVHMRGGKEQRVARCWRTCQGGNRLHLSYIEAFGHHSTVFPDYERDTGDRALRDAQGSHDYDAFRLRLDELVRADDVRQLAMAGPHDPPRDVGVTAHQVRQASLLWTMQKGDLVFSKNLKKGRRDYIVGVVSTDFG